MSHVIISRKEVINRIGKAPRADKLASRSRTITLARAIGIRLNNASPKHKKWVWTGKVLFIGRQRSADIVHEIAHFQCAPKSRRCCPDFGLGQSFDAEVGVGYLDNVIVSPTIGEREEKAASILGILWQVKLGIGSAAYTYSAHDWTFHDEDVGPALRNLRKWGLLSSDAQPLYRVRIG